MNFTNRSCDEFIQTVVKVARNHGIEIPSILDEHSQRMLDCLTVQYHGGDPVGDALEVARQAVQKAKLFNCYDSSYWYRDKKVFFKTYCYRYGYLLIFLTQMLVLTVSLLFPFADSFDIQPGSGRV